MWPCHQLGPLLQTAGPSPWPQRRSCPSPAHRPAVTHYCLRQTRSSKLQGQACLLNSYLSLASLPLRHTDMFFGCPQSPPHPQTHSYQARCRSTLLTCYCPYTMPGLGQAYLTHMSLKHRLLDACVAGSRSVSGDGRVLCYLTWLCKLLGLSLLQCGLTPILSRVRGG